MPQTSLPRAKWIYTLLIVVSAITWHASHAQLSNLHGGKAVESCYVGENNNCFVNYTDGSFNDFYNTSCAVVSGCNANVGSERASHGGRTVASCFAGERGNCFVNYTDGSYQDFLQTSCPAVSGCGVDPGASGTEHGGRSVASCFAGTSGNCFVNYTDGSFKDFYATSCPAVSGCDSNVPSVNDFVGGNAGGNPAPPSGSPSSSGFAPPLLRNYTAADCTYTISAGNSFASALASAQPGEKVCLRGGSYPANNYLNNVQGTPDKFIVLMSYPGETATIVASDYKAHGLNLLTNVSYFEIYDLDFQGAADNFSSATVPTYQAFPSGILGGNTGGSVHHIKIVNNRVRNFSGGGINLYYMTHADIQGNVVYDNARWSENMESGISIYKPKDFGQSQNNWTDSRGDGYSILIRHNIVSNNENRAAVPTDSGDGVVRPRVSDGNCIVLDSFREVGYSGRSLITQNVCYNNGSHGLHLFLTDNATVRNNTSVYSGKTWWDSSNNGNLNLWGAAAELSNSLESRNNIFENNVTWAHPYSSSSWNIRVDAGPGYVYGSDADIIIQSISQMNTAVRNNIFVVSGTQGAPYLPTDNGNQVVTTNPGLVMSPSESASYRDYRIVSGSLLDQLNVGATFYKN